jgi:hypothetical protein
VQIAAYIYQFRCHWRSISFDHILHHELDLTP